MYTTTIKTAGRPRRALTVALLAATLLMVSGLPAHAGPPTSTSDATQADRWWDLAVATWSTVWNIGPGWEDDFLRAYEIERDDARIAQLRNALESGE